MQFGEFLYTLRKERGMTQAGLAEALGVTNKAVSKWETGEAMPETSLLLPLSRILGVTVDELLDGKRAERGGERSAEEDEEEYGGVIKNHLFTRGKDDGEKTLPERICGLICAALALSGLAAFLFIGVFTGLWHPYWVIVPVCCLSCGIIGIAFDFFNKEKIEKKRARGENAYIGGVCGIIMLACVIVYFTASIFTGLWHPLWLIFVCGAFACAVLGAAGGIISHRKK